MSDSIKIPLIPDFRGTDLRFSRSSAWRLGAGRIAQGDLHKAFAPEVTDTDFGRVGIDRPLMLLMPQSPPAGTGPGARR
jgi:hypothetical protein